VQKNQFRGSYNAIKTLIGISNWTTLVVSCGSYRLGIDHDFKRNLFSVVDFATNDAEHYICCLFKNCQTSEIARTFKRRRTRWEVWSGSTQS